MNILITEQQFNMISEKTEEIGDSIKFDKWNRYKWIDDKSDTGAYTSMTTKDPEGKVRFSVKTQLLPKSQILAHNLFTIKGFKVTGALKHNQINKIITSPDSEKQQKTRQALIRVIPHESIKDFKQYIGKYIIKYLIHLKKDIDVILTPQSSSEFNAEIANITSQLYKQYFRKDLTIQNNAFIKTPETAKPDIEYGREYLKRDIKQLYTNISDDKLDKILQKTIQDVYDLITVWQTEGKIKKYIEMVHNLESQQKEIRKGRYGNIPVCKQKKVDEIQTEIDLILNLLETNVSQDTLKNTRFYKYKSVTDKPRQFQMKSLPDGIRQSIYNLISISKEPDTCYSYTKKSGEIISGVAPFIEKLKRNNKTILIFDDNLSSGRTMDDAALALINAGIDRDNIVIITLGVVPKSSYGKFSKFYKQ